jgi:tetratricopeptide (TPR) repeat protein
VLGRAHLLLGHVDEAIEWLTKARSAGPRVWYTYFWLAGALGLKGEIGEAQAALAEGIRLKPEVKSLFQFHSVNLRSTNPQFLKLREETLDTGLRRAGLPD